jgi:hypothetical protein
MDLLPFFEWADASSVGQAISDSTWAFAVIESVHLLGLSVIGGAILIVDLRLLGVGLKNQPVAQVARNAQPWLVGSLAMMIATGILLFASEPMKLYYSGPFAWKMTCLVLGTLFAFTVRRKVALAAEGRVRPLWQKMVGVVSIGLWFVVAAAGRWIGFAS